MHPVPIRGMAAIFAQKNRGTSFKSTPAVHTCVPYYNTYIIFFYETLQLALLSDNITGCNLRCVLMSSEVLILTRHKVLRATPATEMSY